MPRSLKIILAVVGIFALLVVGAALAGHYIVSRQDNQFLRQKIEARTLAATGFQLQVLGPMELPYSLIPSVVFRDVRLNNPEYEGERNLLEAEELRIQFALIPLLKGEVVVYESSMYFVNINLEVDEEGNENWITGGQSGAKAGLPAQIAVHTVDSHQLNISYTNLETGMQFQGSIDDINIRAPLFDDQIQVTMRAEYAATPIEVSGRLGSSKDILHGNPFPIDLDIDIYDVDIDVSGRVDRIEDGEFSDLLLRLDVQGGDLRELEGLAGQSLPETKRFSATTALSLDAESIVISNLFAEIAWLDSEVGLAGDIGSIETLSGIDMTVAISGNDATDISNFHEISWLPDTDAYDLSGTVRGNWPSLELTDVRLHLELDDIVADVAGAVTDIAELGGFDLEVSVRGRDLSDWIGVSGLSLPHTQSYQGDGRINGAWPGLSLSAANATLQREGIRVDLSGGIDDLSELAGLDIGILANGEDLAGIPELSEFEPLQTDAFDLDARLTGNTKALSARVNSASAVHGSHTVTLSGEIGELFDLSALKLQVQVNGKNLAELNDVFGLSVPPTDIYRMSADLYSNANQIAASNISVDGEMPGASFEIRGRVGRILDLHDVDLQISAVTEDLSSLNRYVNFRLPVSEPVEVSGQLRGTAPDVRLDDFTLRSGESLVKGSIGVRMGERLSVEGSVSSGVLDLSPYLVAIREEEEQSRPGDDRLFSEKPIDLSFFDHFDAHVTLDNLELFVAGPKAHVDQATITLDEGSLLIEPLLLTRNDATFSGHFRVEKQDVPRYQLDMSIENMDLVTFLRDIRVQEFSEGRFDLALDLHSSGTSVRELASNLDGNVAAFVSEARIPQVSTTLRTVDVVFELLPWIKRREDVTVNCAISQVDVSKGMATVNLLYLDSIQMTLVGGGTINLQDERLDLRFAPRPKKRKFLAHNIDITMKGSLAEPRLASAGAAKWAATSYGKYALIGPLGLLVPTSWSKKHPCVGSLQEFRQQQAEAQ